MYTASRLSLYAGTMAHKIHIQTFCKSTESVYTKFALVITHKKKKKKISA